VNIEQLIGKWSLKREIFAPRDQRKSQMTGSASFNPTKLPQTLFYREELSHQINEVGNFLACQQYLYKIEENELSIYFDSEWRKSESSPKLFVTLPCDNPQGVHLCGQDEYRVKLIQFTPNLIQMEVNVSGPQKKHHIQTILKRP